MVTTRDTIVQVIFHVAHLPQLTPSLNHPLGVPSPSTRRLTFLYIPTHPSFISHIISFFFSNPTTITSFQLQMDTLTGSLKHIAGIFPDRRALSVSGKFDITHSRLNQLIDHAAASLVAAGVKPHDVVALTFPNTVEYVIMFLAVIRVRATAAPLNQAYTTDEFEFYLSDSESKLLLTAKEGNEAAETAASKIGIRHSFWSDMIKYNATWYTAVPTIHQIILDRHLTKPESDYPKLRFIRSCSASLAPSILARLEEAFNAPVLEAYAMTEATHLMASNPLPENGPHVPGSVGKPVGQEMAILDENGVEQKAGANGEVCIRGPNVTSGYKNNPEANKSAFLFGWFHTGDIGYFDSDGYLHLVGRIKELINRGGEKISPIEVDAVLLSHPDVAQAVCFGVPDDKYGEEINCAVIPREGSGLDEEEVSRFCKKNLAAFKVPKKVFITDSVPKTATGKIQRRIVAEHFLTRISTAKVPKFGA
ncbi:putative oxalate--CoA ligase [Helianthus annuus]|nr:putative oxalate--CoA ligase [Helianthus annuus]KAJ0707234.1 putative oxalate--CoA ligase [Helianthus annuus]KAJ0711252.1 putative oxalate--CoA ligase [Helianthus annuus]